MKKWMVVSKTNCLAVKHITASVQAQVSYTVQTAAAAVEGFNVVEVAVDPAVADIRVWVGAYDAETDTQKIEITAKDEVNLLYAAADFENHYLPYAREQADSNIFYKPLFTQPMKEYDYVSKPKIRYRGLWTWGHVIYNYKKYIDHMVALKMNTLIVWNDFVPLNIREVIAYAHERGVGIYLGYAWGWDTTLVDLTQWEQIAEHVVKQHRQQYADIPCDGIYFQTFTEHTHEVINGLVVAQTAVKMVNRVSQMLLEDQPDLKILFGLHATSVLNRREDFQELDPRVSIIWEDMGAFPYHYRPAMTDGYEQTRKNNRELQDLREGGFGAVLKGVICLNWNEFQHQDGPFYMGEATEKGSRMTAFAREKYKLLQAYWIRNAGYARELISDFHEDAMVTALVEDGYFEEAINYPTALYGEMLWDPDRDTGDILLQTALRPDVTFF